MPAYKGLPDQSASASMVSALVPMADKPFVIWTLDRKAPRSRSPAIMPSTGLLPINPTPLKTLKARLPSSSRASPIDG